MPFRACLALLVFLVTIPPASRSASNNQPQALKLSGDLQYTHDPSIAKDGDTWYLFGTANGPLRKGELPIRCSKDLHEWKFCGYVLDKMPDWIVKISPKTRELWAPDISYFNGEYHLYYAFSVFGKNTSGIALLTNKTLNPTSPEFHWKDKGVVLQSRVEDDYNAIDPNLVIDEKGQPWLAFGSFWTGIKMRQIDANTGLLSSTNTKLYSVASRKRPENPPLNPPGLPGDWQAVEAPFIVHHGDYFYLFRFVLPRNQEQLQNDGGPLQQRHGPLCRREGGTDDGRRWHITVAGEYPLAGPRRRIRPAAK